jgi:UDPglucose--hexose-1-phosphate uridylyltransferase
LPAFDPTCPFCPGNERETPGELCRWPAGGDWEVRVVPNKYPAVARQASGPPAAAPPLQAVESAVGRHEVIIEARAHDRRYTELGDGEVLEVMKAYRARFAAAAADEQVAHVIIFRNQGAMANASIEHLHSQLAGLGFVPPALARKLERSQRHLDSTGRTLLLDVLEGELTAGARIVEATDDLVTFVPFAPTFEFEIWVAPRQVPPRFDRLDEARLARLGIAVRRAASAMELALDCPDYNAILQAPPLSEGADAALPWYFQIIPRRYLTAGFELGIGVHILLTTPEEAAARLRSVQG